MNINEFSLSFLKHIFTYLSLEDAINCVNVCHYWRNCVDGVRDTELDANGNMVCMRAISAKCIDFADGVLNRFTHLILDQNRCTKILNTGTKPDNNNNTNDNERTLDLVFIDKILMRCPNLRVLQIIIIDEYVETSDELIMLIALRLPLLRTLVLSGIYGYSEQIIDYLYPRSKRVVYNCSHTYHVM